VKFTDDYSAKLKIWAGTPTVCRLPRATGLPRFGVKRFDSYDAFNAWKREFMDQIAAQGGVRWTK
jgi:hypothetical protein